MNRLNTRERFLIYFLAGALFLLGNWAMLGSLVNRQARLKADLAAKRSEVHSLRSLVAGNAEALTRDAWLSGVQPKLTNPGQAGVQLLDQIKETARANEVLLENPELGSVETQPACRAVSVQLTAKTSWSSLVRFLHALQTPERFIVCESATLQVDPADAKRMTCRLKIAKWYAP
ncbi:MAG: GspMb/PilO family protein [Chthoniobacteraceae bacterium]|nr:GspMb/PilO family protein [Chthoniobacteraceae bacterium]